jgi:hypothetical protein
LKASPIGSSLGGYILVQNPLFHSGEIRNYTTCFLIALGFEGIAFLWIIFMVNEKLAQKQEKRITMKLKNLKRKEINDEKEEKMKSDKKKEDEKRHPLSLLFDLSNVKEMVKCCIKPRANKVRQQIWLIFITMIVLHMIFTGHFRNAINISLKRI